MLDLDRKTVKVKDCIIQLTCVRIGTEVTPNISRIRYNTSSAK